MYVFMYVCLYILTIFIFVKLMRVTFRSGKPHIIFINSTVASALA